MERSTSKNAAEVLDSFVFTQTQHFWVYKGKQGIKNGLSKLKISSRKREVLLNVSIISDCVSDFTLNMKSLPQQYKNKSATRTWRYTASPTVSFVKNARSVLYARNSFFSVANVFSIRCVSLDFSQGGTLIFTFILCMSYVYF